MRLSRGLLWFAAVAFAGFGLAFSLFPRQIAESIGISLRTDSARTDFVATYGGLEIGVAAFLAYCARRDELVSLGLTAGGYALAGFGLARLAGVLVSEETLPVLLFFLFVELVGSALCFWAARNAQRSRSTRPASPPMLGI
jgi:hypothetical protein